MVSSSASSQREKKVFSEWARSAIDVSTTLPEYQISTERREEYLKSTLNSMCSVIDGYGKADDFEMLKHHIDYSLHRIRINESISSTGEAQLMAATLGVTAISGPCAVPLNKWAREALKLNERYSNEHRDSEFQCSFLQENLVMMSHYAVHTDRKDVVRSINKNIAHIAGTENAVEGYRKCIAAVMALTGACSFPLAS